jgi:hypothetical protein
MNQSIKQSSSVISYVGGNSTYQLDSPAHQHHETKLYCDKSWNLKYESNVCEPKIQNVKQVTTSVFKTEVSLHSAE